MRTMGLSYIGIFMTVLMMGIICTLTMKSSYAETIRDSLDDSIVYSIKMLQEDRKLVEYVDEDGTKVVIPKREIDWDDSLGTGSVDEFKSDFISYLSAHIDSRVSELVVDIYGIDTNVGVLSVNVTAKFMYPSGQEDFVESYKTVILNKYEK